MDKRYGFLGLILAFGAVVSYGVYTQVQARELDRAWAEFEEKATARLTLIWQSVSREQEVVLSLVGFYDGSQNVDRGEFQTFVRPVLKRFTAVQALEWIPRVTASERLNLEEEARKDGYRDFSITERSDSGNLIPARSRAEYFPVFYVEPFEGNESALGFDLGSHPARRAALEKARDTGVLTVSGKVDLVQGGGGVLVFAPVYEQGQPKEILSQRRQHLRGFILAVLALKKVVEEALATRITLDSPAGIDVYLFDDDAERGAQLLYLHSSGKRKGTVAPPLTRSEAIFGINKTLSFVVGDRTWTLVARPVLADLGLGFSWQALGGAFITAFLTLILAIYLLTVTRRSRYLENLISEREKAEAELAKSEARFRSFVEYAPSPISIKDRDGRILALSPSAGKVFKVDPEKVIGKTFASIVSHERFEEIKKADAAVFETGKPTPPGQELIAEFGDGQTLMMTKFPIRDVDGNITSVGTIGLNITEREQVKKALVMAKEEAESANEAKSQFLSSMSHELRTPLNAILGFTQILHMDTEHPLTAEQYAATELVLQSGDHLLKLIEGVLDLAQIETGKASLRMKVQDPAAIIGNCAVVAQNLTAQKGLEFYDKTVGWRLPKLKIDETRLQQILLNLLSNAVKYNRDNGTVTLAVKEEQEGTESWLRIAVTDTGPGIAEDLQKKLFIPFSRLGLENSDIPGTGIGLTITRDLVEAMDGRIGFESTLGLGSTFWVEFPIADGTLMVRDGERDKVSQAPTQGTPSRKITGDGKMQTVLCVEDDPSSLRLLERIIERIPNTNMISAHTGELGLDLTEIYQPDVILMDINLPGIDGFAALKRLKSSKATKDIPVIALTARASTRDRARGLESGFEDYLSKPINVAQVIDTISRSLGRS